MMIRGTNAQRDFAGRQVIGHRYRVLLPQRHYEWRAPSAAQSKDCFGRENRTVFRVQACGRTGQPPWTGWFESREDVDAFLWAIVTGTLHSEPALWRLPNPCWYPEFDTDTLYAVNTFVFKTTPTGSNQTSTSPSDWDNAHNAIETIGAGGSGGRIQGLNGHGTGAGGGAWNGLGNHASLGANFTFAAPGTTTYVWQVGTGGGGAGPNTTNADGTDGGDTWFNATTLGASSCGSKGGTHGVQAASGSTSGGAGGVAASGVGSGKDGGRGGNLTGTTGPNGASGGGGAGGSTAAGAAGGDSAGANVQTAGGQGDPAVGGAGGTAGTNDGSAGTEIDSSATGSGGGGGGNFNAGGAAVSGAGGTYGGAGGGAKASGASNTTTRAGASGLVALIYTPLVAVSLGMFNFGDVPVATQRFVGFSHAH